MEEGLQGLLMGAVLVMFLIAMESDDGAENDYGTENFRKRE